MTISAEDARAKLAEKRRIYANCLGALTAYGEAAVNGARGTALSPARRAELLEETNRARLAAGNGASEVNLIGPTEVAALANRAMRALLRVETDSQASGDAADAISKVMLAMRRDVGEPTPAREEDEMPQLPGL